MKAQVKVRVKVVGLSWEGRRSALSGIEPGTPMFIVPEPDNEHDPNAIAVYRKFSNGNSRKVGYLPAGLAAVRTCSLFGHDCEVARVRYHPGDGEPAGIDLFVAREEMQLREQPRSDTDQGKVARHLRVVA